MGQVEKVCMVNNLKMKISVISMIRGFVEHGKLSGSQNGSQFFITAVPIPHSDWKRGIWESN
jgi:hypothetical protein